MPTPKVANFVKAQLRNLLFIPVNTPVFKYAVISLRIAANSHQSTFAEAGFEKLRKKTRREQFLDEYG